MIDLKRSSYKIINSDYEIWNSFNVDGIIYFAKKNNGIYKIINGDVVLVSDDPKLINSKLVGISKFNELLVFITSTNGILYF